ncbi:hypothetical protein [Mycolicibacter sinensis]|uniref:PEP-CTERM sorting domain-containing protein n=1 Tax=Mycolicibacter sinensis (strain JDM601) TaxID=875328 RepID=A0A1A2EDJ3_MYCSD|nr:hypothetical protein [Mycolicibacter sinensis]OBG02846.1 hypothetical protein A5772_00345 [Mycolicibacter sinensis]OBG09502.1 hypothetical protein A5771_01345 [Mycolicibacter sinensis]
MDIRKIGIIGSFAAGAALALAPLAAADTPANPPDFSNILLAEVQSFNWLFGTQATLAGVDEGVITPGDPTAANPLSFSTITAADLQANAAFAALVYGPNWADEMSDGVTGSYNLFNGALTQFTDASNVLMYAFLTGGQEIDINNAGDYLIGSEDGIEHGLSGDGFLADFGNFTTAGFSDLFGYFAPADLDPGV